MHMSRRRIRLAALALSVAVSGCHNTTGVTTDFSRALARWHATAPARYQVTERVMCFCAPQTTRAKVVVVQDNVVVSAHYVDTGELIPQSELQYIATIDMLFGYISNAAAHGTATVTYDATYGFPVTASLDPLPGAVDDESSYTLSDFRPL